ncbi:oxysterol-binding protein-related protein 4C-like [Cucurbita moschata]|uniref:Oxysterol-binding protein-related protein 4C-like n=1 Tax=Cucurbita moschata TaxID=3662 RepID=A0A6J1EQP7_CUCMO|nr:oxysterol-binding protein-related protein 4C-like [Cucurbita moschata]
MGAGVDTEGEVRRITLTKPLSLEGGSDAADYRSPNLLKRILSLFKDIRPGSDLSHFKVPPQLNMPKSQLQCYGESVYCFNEDMLRKCNNGKNPIDRFVAVVAWNISTLRPLTFGIAPFNPILGETHHASAGSLNILLEQISHHPPVSALHATDEKENLEMIWCQLPKAKFYGTSVEVEVSGKRELRLANHRETYVMNSPNLMFKFLPTPAAEWSGSIRIACQDTGLEAELRCKGLSFFGFGGNARSIKGKILDSFSSKPLYEINGQWDRTVTVKNIESGKVEIIYNAKDNIWRLRTPTVQDLRSVLPSESAVAWSEVSQGIMSNDWEAAKRAKRVLEDKQREFAREMASRGETWAPKFFTYSHTKEGEWECTPIQKSVPPAPIVVPK